MPTAAELVWRIRHPHRRWILLNQSIRHQGQRIEELNILRLRDRSQARFSGNTHSLISLRHLAHGGPIGNPSGPVPKSHLAFRCRHGMHAL